MELAGVEQVLGNSALESGLAELRALTDWTVSFRQDLSSVVEDLRRRLGADLDQELKNQGVTFSWNCDWGRTT